MKTKVSIASSAVARATLSSLPMALHAANQTSHAEIGINSAIGKPA